MSDYKRKGERSYREDSPVESSRKFFKLGESYDRTKDEDRDKRHRNRDTTRDTRDRHGDRNRVSENDNRDRKYTSSNKDFSGKSDEVFSSSKIVTSEKWGKEEDNVQAGEEKGDEEVVKAKPNFGLTGALAKDERTGNIVNGVVLKYSVPLDSAKPNRMWRLYVFKDEKIIETFHLHRQATFLMGRDKRAVDIILEHPSCSSQHAVIQFRKVKLHANEDDDEDEEREEIKPYLMDLSSTHKTNLNGKQIEDCRYYELREKDCIKFGGSSREYVLLHAASTENYSD